MVEKKEVSWWLTVGKVEVSGGGGVDKVEVRVMVDWLLTCWGKKRVSRWGSQPHEVEGLEITEAKVLHPPLMAAKYPSKTNKETTKDMPNQLSLLFDFVKHDGGGCRTPQPVVAGGDGGGLW
ncbi:hypothetical protein R6Q59_027727 [Mikania micrantha]